MISRPVVDLPQPDSPTRPRLSPSATVEVDAVDGLDRADRPLDGEAARDREVLGQAGDVQERFAVSVLLMIVKIPFSRHVSPLAQPGLRS